MGFRTWLYKKTGIRLKRVEEPWREEVQALNDQIKSLKETIKIQETSSYELTKKLQKLEPFIPEEQTRKICTERNISLDDCVSITNPEGIGANTKIGYMTYIQPYFRCQSNTTIGRYCSIADRVRIGAANHPTDWLSTNPFQYWQWEGDEGKCPERYLKFNPVEKLCTIGNDVWIAASVFILPGVTVGDGAIIGAHSVVTKDVPPYAIVGGAPAKIIRYRFDEPTIQELLDLKWWELPREALYQNKVQFNDIRTAIKQIKAFMPDSVQQK